MLILLENRDGRPYILGGMHAEHLNRKPYCSPKPQNNMTDSMNEDRVRNGQILRLT